jgi:hypothetical protein
MRRFNWSRGSFLVFGPMIAAVALLGYGAGTGSLSITGHAQTGTFDATWTSANCNEQSTDLGVPNATPVAGEVLGKAVGSTTASAPPADVIQIASTNAYPGYGASCSLQYQNTGTLPIKVNASAVSAVSGLTGCTVSEAAVITLACNELTLTFTPDLNPNCIDAGQVENVSLVYRVEQKAPQAGTMAFNIVIPLVQCEGQNLIGSPPSSSQPPGPPKLSGSFSQTGGVGVASSTNPQSQSQAQSAPISEVAGIQVAKVGDGGLLGKVGLQTPPDDSGSGKSILAAALLLAMSGVGIAGVRRAKRSSRH